VLDGRAEAQELEAHLQKSRMTLIKTSIILAVSATNEDELKRRCDIVKDTYQDMMFQVEQPYGDQWLAFNEFLPGAKRYIKEYTFYGASYGCWGHVRSHKTAGGWRGFLHRKYRYS
jgi:hypothetical protein